MRRSGHDPLAEPRPTQPSGPTTRPEPAELAGGRNGTCARRRRFDRGWLAIVFVVALAARLWGIDWQLPDALYYDELKYVSWASAWVDDRALSRTDFRNPSLYRRLLAAEFRLADLVAPDQDDHRLAVRRLLIARVTIAVFGAGAVAFTALAAARLFGPWPGLAAGLALGLSLLHVNLSHLALNDVSASFFLAAGLLFGVRGLVAPRPREYLLAGLAAGLATAAKYNSGVVLGLPLAGAALLGATAKVRPTDAARFVGLALIGSLAGLLLGMPEWLWAAGAIVSGMAEQAALGTRPLVGQSDDPVPVLYARTVVHGIGGPTVALASIGLAWMLRADYRRALVLLVSPALYLAMMLRNELFAGRFALPLLPFVAIFAAAGLSWLAARQRTAAQRGAVVGLALLAIAVPSGIDVVQHNRLATSTDTRVLAQEWVRRRPRDSRVAAQTFALPASWGGHERLRGYRIRRFESLADPAELTRLACDNTRYVLVASFAHDRESARRPAGASPTGYDQLERHASLVQTFSPFREGRRAAVGPDDVQIPFWDLHAYATAGPLIEVYQLPGDGATLCPKAGG